MRDKSFNTTSTLLDFVCSVQGILIAYLIFYLHVVQIATNLEDMRFFTPKLYRTLLAITESTGSQGLLSCLAQA